MVTCFSDSLAVPFHFSLPWAKFLDLLDCFWQAPLDVNALQSVKLYHLQYIFSCCYALLYTWQLISMCTNITHDTWCKRLYFYLHCIHTDALPYSASATFSPSELGGIVAGSFVAGLFLGGLLMSLACGICLIIVSIHTFSMTCCHSILGFCLASSSHFNYQ